MTKGQVKNVEFDMYDMGSGPWGLVKNVELDTNDMRSGQERQI
jgi:hypothetical protein